MYIGNDVGNDGGLCLEKILHPYQVSFRVSEGNMLLFTFHVKIQPDIIGNVMAVGGKGIAE